MHSTGIQNNITDQFQSILQSFTHKIKEQIQSQKVQIIQQTKQKVLLQINQHHNDQKLQTAPQQPSLYDIRLQSHQSKLQIMFDSLSKIKTDLKTQITNVNYNFSMQIKNLRTSIDQLNKKIQKQSLMIQSEKTNLTDTSLIVHPNSMQFEKFKIHENIIQKIGSNDYLYLFGNQPIIKKNKNVFKIIKSQNGNINFGVINKAYINEKQPSLKDECIYYSGYHGKIYESYSPKKHGLVNVAQNNIVSMFVEGNTIQWQIQDQIITYKSQQKINQQWVPFIVLFHVGDKIQWI